jgi:ferredoxin-type protein NapH
MAKNLGFRQKARLLLLFLWIMMFPVTLFYFSPYVPYQGLQQQVIAGSILVFLFLFVSSIFLGRIFCGWICPGGAIQHFVEPINPKPIISKKVRLIKYFLIWLPWLSGLISLFLFRPGNYTIDFFFLTHNGVSLAGDSSHFIVFYFVVLLFVLLPVLYGKSTACHSICWMAPFQVIGSFLGRVIGLPQLHVKAKPELCISCSLCNRSCPMSISVQKETLDHGCIKNLDCILCGQCVDICPKKVLSFSFKKVKPGQLWKLN